MKLKGKTWLFFAGYNDELMHWCLAMTVPRVWPRIPKFNLYTEPSIYP